MDTKIDPEHTSANPDLAGFDLDTITGLGAFRDGSGGGVRCLAWEMKRLRETQERVDRLRAFVHKFPVILAKLNWSVNVTHSHPWQEEGPFIAEVEISGKVYNKEYCESTEIAALWPEAQWRRVLPYYGHEEDRVRDYAAEVDGVIIRITKAEVKPEPVKVDRFERCGVISIPKAKPEKHTAR